MDSQFLHFDRLVDTDAARIARVEAKLRARKRRAGAGNWRNLLDRLELEERNLSFGLFDKSTLVGYAIAYELPTGPGHPPAVRIHDLVLLKPYRFRLRTMLVELDRLIATFVPGASIETIALSDTDRRKWQRSQRLQRRLGYAPRGSVAAAASKTGGLNFDRRVRDHGGRSRTLPVPAAHWSTDIGGQHFHVACVTDSRQWAALEPLWDMMLGATPGSTVFQSFDYLRSWWRYFGLSDRLFILVIKNDTEVVGIAPLMRSPTMVYGRSFTQLGFIGAPWEVDRATFLFARDRDECLAATLRYLLDHQDQWSIFGMFEQPAGSAESAKILNQLRQGKLLSATTATSKCPYLSLDATWQNYHASLPRKFRKNINRSRRLLEQTAPVAMDTVTSWPELDTALRTYRDIERRSWKTKKELGIGRDSHYFGFYRELARRFGRNGEFVMRFLKLGDDAIAGTFGLIFNRVFYSIMITHDQSHNRASPGTLLESLELEQCFNEELTEYDFLGGFLKNKLRWTTTVRDTQNLHFYQRSPQLRLLFLLHFVIKPRTRVLLRKLRLFDNIRKWRKRAESFYTEHIPRSKIAEVRRANMSQNREPAGD